MAEQTAAATINAPVHQVYQLFSHFNDFPKFMTFVKEVTYYDSERSHWAADVVGHREWDAVNENWIPDQQIGWRSTSGLENSGVVTFEPQGADQTHIKVTIDYTPPAGFLGEIGDKLGVGSAFHKKLQTDLDNFAQMVAAAPTGALDPNSSSYLFHEASAAAQGKTTPAQDDTMGQSETDTEDDLAEDPAMTPAEARVNI